MTVVPLSRIINVTLLSAPQGLQGFNVNSLCVFTDETPNFSFPATGYQVYTSPDGVAADFGIGSEAYAQAAAIFSQVPTVLSAGGYLVVVSLQTVGSNTAGTMTTLTPGATVAQFAAVTDGAFHIPIDGTPLSVTGINFGATSAKLVCGTAGDTTPADWAALLTTGGFTITIDGQTITNCNPNFTGVSTMAGVAAAIQTALQIGLAGTTCTWVTDHFVITSPSAGTGSTITVLSTPTLLFDIAKSAWMNGKTGAVTNGLAPVSSYNNVATRISSALTGATCAYSAAANASQGGFVFTSSSVGALSKIGKLTIGASGTDIANSSYLDGEGNVLIVNGQAIGSVESLVSAFLRTKDAIYYFGVLYAHAAQSTTDLLNLATCMQSQQKLLFIGSNADSDITNVFTPVQQGGLTHTRCKFYKYDPADIALARIMAAASASRLFGTDFTGSNTASTMSLKSLRGIQPDLNSGGDYYNVLAESVGFDMYLSFAGIPGSTSYGANDYDDQVYGELWLQLALQVAGFNYLATVNTKIPQNEPGMDGLKSSYIAVLNQGLRNGFLTNGQAWTSATVFGNPLDLHRNITDVGYYVYSLPVSQQSPSDRAARKAPIIQIAVKESGAIHHSDVTVFVN